MSNKDFIGGLSSLLGEAPAKPKAKAGRPKTSTKERAKSSQEGKMENETKANFILNVDTLVKIKAIANRDRSLIRDVVGKALENAIATSEKKYGAVKPIPEK